MIWESLTGKVLAFWPVGQCPNGVAKSKPLLGAVVSITPLPPTERGNLPTAAVLVRGRSGKEATIDFTECRTQVFEHWKAAMKYESEQ